MAHTREDARHRIVELLEAMEFEPGEPIFAAVYPAQMKKVGGESPVAMVWNGPLWFSNRRTADAAVNTAGIRVGIYVARNNEPNTENMMDLISQRMLQLVKQHLSEDGYWYYIEFSNETFPDYPPIEEGTQYRREIFDLRVYFELGSL